MTDHDQTPENRSLPLSAILGLALALSLIVNVWLLFGPDDGDGSGGGSTATERTFDTPEAAVEYVVGNVRGGDFISASQACATTSLAAHLDYEAFNDRIGAWTPQSGWSPNEFDYWTSANQSNALSHCGQSLRLLAWELVTPEDFDTFRTLPQEELESLADIFDPTDMASLELVRVDEIAWENEDMATQRMIQCATFGSETCTDVFVLLRMGEEHFAYSASLIDYGDGWHFQQPTSSPAGSMAGLPASAPEPTTPEMYEDLLEETRDSLA